MDTDGHVSADSNPIPISPAATFPESSERVRLGEWAGGIADEPARLPSIRIGRRWISSLWLLPLGIAALVIGVAIAQHLRQFDGMQEFIARYPGTAAPRGPIEPGLPAWLRWSHLFNLVFMMFIIRAGLQILADHPRLYLNSGSTPDMLTASAREIADAHAKLMNTETR